jgi:predicted Zn-dependent protease
MKPLLWTALLVQLAQLPHTTPRQESGVNLFSLQQDVAIGLESAREADRVLPLIRDPYLSSYIQNLGTMLGGSSPLPLRYTFRIVNSSDANAETFPGGHVYIDRGLVELTSNEHELASLLAHEIGHAAARHGTRQLSAQLMVQTPASALAGLSAPDGWKDALGRLGIHLAARPTFLRYSREQEIEANSIAVEILVKSPYSPYGLISILRSIDTQAALPGYSFNHPHVEEAFVSIDEEVQRLRVPPRRTLRASAEFMEFKAALAKLPLPTPDEEDDEELARVELPNEHVHPESYYRLRYPEGWLVHPTSNNGAMISAPGGIVPTTRGNDLRTGIMFDLFSVSDRQISLEQASNRLIVFLRQRNQDLRTIPGAQSQMLLGSAPALRTVMIANSRPTQVVWVVTRQYYESLFYIVCVATEDEFATLQPRFEQILRSVELR